jgi:hypothetical protein
MAKLRCVAVIFAVSMAGVPAYGEDNGLVAPELGKPTPGQLLDQDYLTSTGATVRRFSVCGPDAARPRDPAAGQQDRQQHLLGLLRLGTADALRRGCLLTPRAWPEGNRESRSPVANM